MRKQNKLIKNTFIAFIVIAIFITSIDRYLIRFSLNEEIVLLEKEEEKKEFILNLIKEGKYYKAEEFAKKQLTPKGLIKYLKQKSKK